MLMSTPLMYRLALILAVLLLKCCTSVISLSDESIPFIIYTIVTEKDVLHLDEWLHYHRIIGIHHVYLVNSSYGGVFIDENTDFQNFASYISINGSHSQMLDNVLARDDDALSILLPIGDFLVLRGYNTIQELLRYEKDKSLFSIPTYSVISKTSWSPEFLLKKSVLRTSHPTSLSYAAYLPDVVHFDDYLRPVLKSGISAKTLLNHDDKGAVVFSVSLLTRTEHRWYVEWLCGEYPHSVSGVVGGHDRRDYSAVCSVYHESSATADSSSGSSVGIVGQTHFRDRYSSDSEWMRWFDAYYDALRSEYESAQLVEDTAAWEVLHQDLSHTAVDNAYYDVNNEDLFSSLILSNPAIDRSSDSVMAQYTFNVAHRQEVRSMPFTVYFAKDIPHQILQYCVDHVARISDCEEIMNFLIPAETVVNPALVHNNQEIIVDVAYMRKLLKYYKSLCSVFEPTPLEQAIYKQQELMKKLHPDECFRGWRSGETMLLSSQNKSFLMYVINHDDASEALIYDTLFHSSSNNSSRRSGSNGVLVPVRVRSSVFFEYIAYREVLPGRYVSEWSQLQYVGITTYKTVVQYASLCTYELERLLAVGAAKDYDVIPLVRPKHDLMATSVLTHTRNFKTVWDAVLTALGYNQTTIRRYDRMKPFYRSSMLIKPSWLVRLSQFMSRAMEVVQFNATLYELCSVDARYFDSDAEVSRRIFNSSRYQLFPFVFERLPSFYLISEGASVCHGSDECPFNFHWTGSN